MEHVDEQSLERAKDRVRGAVVDRLVELGMTEAELATASGVSLATIKRFLPNPITGRVGTMWPRRHQRQAIAKALGWKASRLDQMLVTATPEWSVIEVRLPEGTLCELNREQVGRVESEMVRAGLRAATEVRKIPA